MDYKTNFDGPMVEFETGATRSDSTDKGRYDLIPSRPLERVAIVYERGGKKHKDRNWEKGMKMSRLLDSAQRHIRQYIDGDRSEDHMAQAVWNTLGAMFFEEHMPSMNDLPNHKAMRDAVDKQNDCIQQSIDKILPKQLLVENEAKVDLIPGLIGKLTGRNPTYDMDRESKDQ